jgi:uncharacterized protein
VSYKFKYLIIFLSLVWVSGCTNLFFQPSKRLVVNPGHFGIKYQDVYFKSVDELDLHGWWFPAQGESKALLLFLHGNGENISTHSAAVHWLTKHQYDVFVFDYRGYGLSQGVPDMDGVMTDIYQAFDYANKRNGKDKKLFVMGQSLGASMGIYSIAQKPEGIDGAIFVSPFSDYREITRDVLAGSWLTWAFQWPISFTISNEYRPLDYVKKLPGIPILYLYSDDDRVIPSEQVKDLFEKSNRPKYIDRVQGPHSGIFSIDSNREIVLKYLNEWLVRK